MNKSVEIKKTQTPANKTWMYRAIVSVLQFFLHIYQRVLSPFLHQLFPSLGCRFHPSCSEYAKESIEIHGPIRGILLTSRRILKCNPFHKGGIDLPLPRSPK